ncbi:MAG TPA: 50S ribosomal protein L17 [Telluribacter sp.]|nr:50S ribosomal protein L17 [Telluribacter sp.]
MRHGKKDNHLGRTASHRRAMLSNMASSLILHKRIETTLAKAKELRKYVEPLLTRSKDDSTHSRRIVFSYLNDKDSVKELFNVVSDKIADRPGGYTRIIKLGTRQGDAAETCLIELVDFNEALLLTEADKTTKTRRSRRGGKKSGAASESTAPAEDAAPAAKAAPAVTDEAPAAAEEASGADAPGADAPGADAPADDVKPASDETEETEK